MMLKYEQKSKRHYHRPARGLINSSVVREVLVDDGMRALGHSVGDLQEGRSPGFSRFAYDTSGTRHWKHCYPIQLEPAVMSLAPRV